MALAPSQTSLDYHHVVHPCDTPIIIDFSVRLPGFNLHIMKYVDESNHELRYTLKARYTRPVEMSLSVYRSSWLLSSTYFMICRLNPGRRTAEDEKEYRKGEQRDDSLGKFDWEPEPSSNDIE
jgi:hypothetical protein